MTQQSAEKTSATSAAVTQETATAELDRAVNRDAPQTEDDNGPGKKKKLYIWKFNEHYSG